MTLLIKNVKILGGEQQFKEHADVFINGDKISAIGNFPNKGADETIEGQGAYLAPGFIDVNTDSDHYLSLFDYPEQEDFIRQGVTTIVGGMCGSSLAPLVYGSLESVQKWGDINKVNIDWHTLKEFLEVLNKKHLSINFATLIGHSTIRRAILGEQIRNLTKKELEVFEKTLRNALSGGGFGLSTGLGYVHGQKTPYSELKFLSNITKNYDGVYATHLRKSKKDIGESIDETIKLANDVGVKTLISHFLPIFGAEEEYEEAIAKINNLPQETNLHFDLYPSDISVFTLYTFLPEWVKTGGKNMMLEKINNGQLWPKISKEFSEINPENFVVAKAPGNDYLVGRSLKELVDIYEVHDYRIALLKLMFATQLRGIIFYKNINYKLIWRAISSPRSLIASNAASYPYSGKALKPERAVSTFSKFLTAVLENKIMSIEDAIKKITLEPAKKFGFQKRGVVKEGNFADLTIFSSKGKSSHGENPVEIKSVIVNGETVLKDGVFKGKLPGQALKHNSK